MFYGIDNNGNLTIRNPQKTPIVEVSFSEIISGLIDRGIQLPVLLRVENILDLQITRLNESFQKAIKSYKYNGQYRGVYPIKVNQQKHVLQEITRYGARYHHGLEVGSKAELIAALGILNDREACLICNGYKDEEFIDLGLNALKMGYKIFLVLEMPSELELILERSKALKIKPLLGIRFKLSTQGGGHWGESCGDRSLFGLNSTQIIEVIDRLRKAKMLDCLQLLHFHLGSQIPNIRDICKGVSEAARLYGCLSAEGAAMGYFDLGGGLAVDYDGSKSKYIHSRNYTLDEYTSCIVEALISVFDEIKIPHPTLISESGRSTVAYYSILLVNILDTVRFEPIRLPENLDSNNPDVIKNLFGLLKKMNQKNFQEYFHMALSHRNQIRQRFQAGEITLRQRSLCENIFLSILHRVREFSTSLKHLPSELEGLSESLADIYYGNFSVFQSLPDAWAIGQVFPVVPLKYLNKAPVRNGIIADITCDSDGRIDRFISLKELKRTLPLHPLVDGEDYYLGFFLVGAYQETLGDLHNLLGDTNVVTIRIQNDGGFEIVRELEGDSIEDVLSYVGYDADVILERFRQKAEAAVQRGTISPRERRKMVQVYEASLGGYTYFETEEE